VTFVSTATTTGSTYTSPTLVAGDIVVLCVGADRAGGALATPSGWNVAADSLDLLLPAGGGATGFAQTTSAIYWRRASGTSLSASFGRNVRVQSVVLRGATSIAGVEVRRINAADLAYPALAFADPMTGHTVHVGVALYQYGTGPAATGDTARQSDTVSASGVRNFAGMDVTRYSWLTTTEKAFTAVSSVAAASSGQRVDGWAVSAAFATVSGPAAPTISAPAAGSVDLAAGFVVSWVPTWAQTGYAIRRKLGAGSWAWWNGTDWSASSETIITSTATTVTVPAAQFSNGGSSYTLEVATVGDALRPSLGTYASVVVVGKAPPTLSSATVSPLSGSDVTSLTPTVTLSGAAGSGGTLTGYRVRVDQDLGDGWVQVLDSGVVASPWTASVAQAANLTNGEPIRFRSVTVQDTTQESAAITSATYTMAHPTPAAPTVVAAQIDHPTSGLPGLRVTITSAATGAVVLYRAGVAVHESAITAGVPLVVDDYSPGAGSVIYSATVTTGDGVSTVRLTSPLGSAAGITLAASHCWLIDELDPATAVQLHIASEGAQGHELHTAVFTPLGQAARLVHTGTPTLPDGSTVLTIDTPDTVTAALSLLKSGRRLTLRGAPTETDPSTGIEYLNPARRVYVVGTPTVEREHAGPWTHRLIGFDWVSAADDGYPPIVEEGLILDGGAL
jgi:hypothetical protein